MISSTARTSHQTGSYRSERRFNWYLATATAADVVTGVVAGVVTGVVTAVVTGTAAATGTGTDTGTGTVTDVVITAATRTTTAGTSFIQWRVR